MRVTKPRFLSLLVPYELWCLGCQAGFWGPCPFQAAATSPVEPCSGLMRGAVYSGCFNIVPAHSAPDIAADFCPEEPEDKTRGHLHNWFSSKNVEPFLREKCRSVSMRNTDLVMKTALTSFFAQQQSWLFIYCSLASFAYWAMLFLRTQKASCLNNAKKETSIPLQATYSAKANYGLEWQLFGFSEWVMSQWCGH